MVTQRAIGLNHLRSKGSGKTAMRLRIDRHLTRYNEENAGNCVRNRYDDFNPFLDHFCGDGTPDISKPEKVLDAWRLCRRMRSFVLC